MSVNSAHRLDRRWSILGMLGLCITLLMPACAGSGQHPMSSNPAVVFPYVVQNGSPPPHWIAFPFPTPASDSLGMAVGPDDNMWFTSNQGEIVRFTMDGSATPYSIPTTNPFPQGIASGSDGNLWFTTGYNQGIWRVTTSGEFTFFALPINESFANGDILSWKDFLWFPAYDVVHNYFVIARLTTSGNLKEFPLLPPTFGEPWGIAVGPDHNIWFTDYSTKTIGRLTPKGLISSFGPTTYQPREITAGPDGNLWFVEATGFGTPPTIGRITTAGTITEFGLGGNADPFAITRGFGNTVVVTDFRGILWFVNTSGAYSYKAKYLPAEFGGAPVRAITRAPDNNYWFWSDGDAGVYVRLLMSASPSSISFSGVGQSQDVVITEKSYGGSWTAGTGDSNIATVAQGQKANTFIVTSVGSGSTKISISDSKSNTLLVPVAVP